MGGVFQTLACLANVQRRFATCGKGQALVWFVFLADAFWFLDTGAPASNPGNPL